MRVCVWVFKCARVWGLCACVWGLCACACACGLECGAHRSSPLRLSYFTPSAPPVPLGEQIQRRQKRCLTLFFRISFEPSQVVRVVQGGGSWGCVLHQLRMGWNVVHTDVPLFACRTSRLLHHLHPTPADHAPPHPPHESPPWPISAVSEIETSVLGCDSAKSVPHVLTHRVNSARSRTSKQSIQHVVSGTESYIYIFLSPDGASLQCCIARGLWVAD